MDTDRLIELIFGTTDLPQVVVGFVFSILGALLSLLLNGNTRDIASPRTPIKFSYKFLFSDNLRRLVITSVLIIVFIRFTKELLGVNLTTYWAFFIGFCSDKLSEYLKTVKRKFFENDKVYNEMPKENIVSSELVETAMKVEEGDEANIEISKEKNISTQDNGVESKVVIKEVQSINEDDANTE